MSTITIDRVSTYQAGADRLGTRHLRVVPSTTRSPQLRLTRRGKIVILTVAVAVIAALAVMFGPSSTATDQLGTPQEFTTVRVLPGTTLWEIAAAANPKADIRDTVDDIVKLNSLPNASALQMGAEIAVPVYDQ